MRVALLTFDFPPEPNGLGRAAFEIAAGLGENGADVTVFSEDRSGVEETAFGRVIGVPAARTGRRLSFLRRRAAIGHLAAPMAFAKAVRHWHRRTPFEVLEATNWYAPAARIVGDLPTVIRNSTAAAWTGERPASLRDRIDLRFASALEARTARRADLLISNTAHHGERIERFYAIAPGKPHHILGLSLPDDLIEEGARSTLPPADRPKEFMFVGRAERRKGFAEALSAIAALRHRKTEAKDAVLHLVGMSPGELDRALANHPDRGRLDGALVDHGRASDRTMQELLGRAHAVLAPSRYESYGLVYREAAAFGRPLVACAEDPSAREFVGEARCGVLAERCEGEAIAAALAEVLRPEVAEACYRAGIAHAGTLRRSVLGRKTLSAYEEAIALHRSLR